MTKPKKQIKSRNAEVLKDFVKFCEEQELGPTNKLRARMLYSLLVLLYGDWEGKDK